MSIKGIVYIGIDPGLVNCGLAIMTPKYLATTTLIEVSNINFIRKVYGILSKMDNWLRGVYCPTAKMFCKDVRVVCENPYLPGKAHDNMEKLVGILEYKFYLSNTVVQLIHPLTLKKHFGSGTLDKKQLAETLIGRKGLKKHMKYIQTLIDKEAWDETDALALAVYGKEHE